MIDLIFHSSFSIAMDFFTTSYYLRPMKYLLTFLLFAAARQSTAQQLQIPYRKGNLWGLSNADKKIIVTPAYDNIYWMQGGWFETTRKVQLKDTLETAPRRLFIRNTNVKLSGLIHNGQVILSNEPFEDFEIVAGKCIVTKCDRRGEDLTKEQFKKYGDKRRFYSLFNLQGKNLHPENFKRIQKIDTTGVSSKDKKSGRYILFLGTSFTDDRSLFVFDADKQEISEWLIKDAIKLEADRFGSDQQKQKILLNVTDKNYNKTTLQIDYSSGKFLLSTVTPAKINTGKYGAGTGESYGSSEPRVVEVGPDSRYDVAVPDAPDKVLPSTKPAFNDYHQLIKDTLFYITGTNERNRLSLPATTKILLREPRGMNQYDPVMAKLNGQFYIITTNALSTAAYDSLIYFGQYFIAWQKINGKSRAGVIKADGSSFVEMQYDSIYAGIPFFDFEDKSPGGKSNYQPVLKEADSKYNYEKRNPYVRAFSDRLTVFVNGKCGVISVKGDTIIPIAYQMIAQNNLGHSRPKEDEFILLKQNDRYGITKLQYNREKKTNEMGFTITPKYNYIPGYYYPNYFGIKNYILAGLYDEHFVFKGFADVYGKEYFED